MIMRHKISSGFWYRTAIPLFLSVFGFLCSGCYETREGMPAGRSLNIPAVEALQARQGSLPLIERLTGVVKARNQVAIHQEVNGTITEVLVK